jgi:hypothetical protein
LQKNDKKFAENSQNFASKLCKKSEIFSKKTAQKPWLRRGLNIAENRQINSKIYSKK